MAQSTTTIYVRADGLKAAVFHPYAHGHTHSILTLTTTHHVPPYSPHPRYVPQEFGFHIPAWLANRIAAAINAASAEGPQSPQAAEAPTIEEPQP